MLLRSLRIGKSRDRTVWADNARGIGILLIILAHTSLGSSWLGDYVDSFRTTLFFFVAGYLFSGDRYDSFRAFFLKKAKTLLLPYFVFAAVSYVYFIFRYSFSGTDYFRELSLLQQFFGIFYSAGTTEWMDFNLPLWFLTCLFVVQITFYALKRVVTSKAVLALIMGVCSLIGYADGVWNPYRLPWGIDVAFTAIVFFGIGHLAKSLFEVLFAKSAPIKIALAGVFFIPNLLFDDPLMNLNMKLHGSYYDFYLEAFSGITLCLLLSSMIRFQWLFYLGRNSLLLTASHMPMLNITKKIMEHVGFIPNLFVVEIIRAALTVLLTIPLIYALNQYPLLLRRKAKQGYAAPKVSS